MLAVGHPPRLDLSPKNIEVLSQYLAKVIRREVIESAVTEAMVRPRGESARAVFLYRTSLTRLTGYRLRLAPCRTGLKIAGFLSRLDFRTILFWRTTGSGTQKLPLLPIGVTHSKPARTLFRSVELFVGTSPGACLESKRALEAKCEAVGTVVRGAEEVFEVIRALPGEDHTAQVFCVIADLGRPRRPCERAVGGG